MLKQLSVFQKILSTMIYLFAWSLFTEQVSAEKRTGTRESLFRIGLRQEFL